MVSHAYRNYTVNGIAMNHYDLKTNSENLLATIYEWIYFSSLGVCIA